MTDQLGHGRGSGEHVSGELVDNGPRGPIGLLTRANSPVEEIVELVPALTRLTAAAWLRSTVWGLEKGAKVSARIVRAVAPEEARELVEEVSSALRANAREMLGINDLERRVLEGLPGGRASALAETGSLKARGADLLRQSADLGDEDGAHPAYARILAELAPDEARILRLLVLDGPQPVIDVRASNLIGVGSQLVARALNMVGTEAGCRKFERVPAYLNNLDRLGLIYFSEEPLNDPTRYQVLEAQPEAMDAIKRAGRARINQRTIRLTAFGKDFCDVCLPVDKAVV
jgi:Abortive infection alpha